MITEKSQMIRNALAIVSTWAVLALSSAAQATEEDANIWLAQNATIDLGKNVVVWLEAQERFTNDASRLGQLLIRPAIGYKLDKTTTMFVGYVYVMTDPVGPVRTHEHRIFQQISFRVLGDGNRFTVTGRTRLEQRLFEGQGGTGWRLRQQIRLTAPLAGKVRAVGWSEPFINLNETAFQPSQLGLWRNFAGVAISVGKGFTLEPGYLNQYVVRNGSDRIDHVANLTLGASF